MMFDRLYHEIKFPGIITELLNCPGLLRLKDVRMANNPFVAFPSFATTSRYEHSLGVCFLAGICASHLELPEKDKLELMIACLYHDAGTPPFAHAMEEVLQAHFGFDHEKNLQELIEGKNQLFDGSYAQVYLGRGLKLQSVCQSKTARQIGIDIHRIARLAVGDPKDPLSSLVNSKGMDLDNIDNVLRASSAMGLIHNDAGALAKLLTSAFVIDNGHICLKGMLLQYVREWQQIRDLQYSAIFESIDDFAYQTMIKKAINLLLQNEQEGPMLDVYSWRLTDSEIIQNVLLKNKASSEIIKRVLLCNPFACVGILYVSGANVIRYVNHHLKEIEDSCSIYFAERMGITAKMREVLSTSVIVANFYPDKRKREITNEIVPSSMVQRSEFDSTKQGVLLGLFTPLSKSGYSKVDRNGKTKRSSISFNRDNLSEMCTCLKQGVLSDFDVIIYGEENDGKAREKIGTDQLGFF